MAVAGTLLYAPQRRYAVSVTPHTRLSAGCVTLYVNSSFDEKSLEESSFASDGSTSDPTCHYHVKTPASPNHNPHIMVRFSLYKSSAASFDKVSTKILRTHGIAVNESIEVEVGFDEPSVVRRTHSYPSGYITETFSNEQETDDADDEKKQVRITATADTDTWVSHSSSDIPSDLGHSQSGTEEWSSEQSDAFDGVSDGIPSIATACNGSEEEEEDVDVIVDAIAKCNFDIVWSGDSVVCVDEGDANTSNPREEELVNEKEAVHEVTDTNLKDGSEKDVKELCINKVSKIELNNSDDIAKEESVVENDNIEESSDNNVDIDDTSADKTESTADNLFKENSGDDCAIDLDSNEKSTVGVVRTVATPDKLTAMMCERISAINNIRGLIEQESETSKYCFIRI